MTQRQSESNREQSETQQGGTPELSKGMEAGRSGTPGSTADRRYKRNDRKNNLRPASYRRLFR